MSRIISIHVLSDSVPPHTYLTFKQINVILIEEDPNTILVMGDPLKGVNLKLLRRATWKP